MFFGAVVPSFSRISHHHMIESNQYEQRVWLIIHRVWLD